MIRIGALRFTGFSKKELLWRAYTLLNKQRKVQLTPNLFEEKAITYTMPALIDNKLEDAYDEIELLAFH